jgi:GNAT superfamily N-acetyltransferase
MDLEEVEIASISVEELIADNSGAWVEQMADLTYHAFREPPWNIDEEKPRLHFGLGVAMMRRNASTFIAKTTHSTRIIGYISGYEVFRESEDHRDLALCKISGTKALDYLFEGGGQVFYGNILCVDPVFRRKHIALRLAAAQINGLRAEGFTYRIGRTAIAAEAMRALYTKLGFQESPVHDALYPERTYWLLRL